jgi:uncharacterized membrane protein
MLEYHNGNIGIGTIYPQQKLDIVGSIKTTGNIVCNNLTVNGTSTTVNTSSLNVEDIILELGGNTTLLLNDGTDRGIKFNYFEGSSKIGFFGYKNNSGNFVFLKDASYSNFIVSGNLGNIQANNFLGNASTVTNGVYTVGNQSISGTKSFTSNVGVGTDNPIKELDVSGNINFTGNLYKNNQLYVSSQWLDSSNNIYFNDNVGIGTDNPIKELDVSGNINFTGNLYKDNQLYVSSQWVDNGNNIYYNDKVGIGTDNPIKELDVSGNINFTGNLYKDNQLYVSSQWLDNGNNIYFDNKIGIGTENPIKELDVSGNINFTGNLYRNNQLYVSSQWLDNGNDIYFDDKVGIGTDNPIKELDVSGNINFTGNLYKDNQLYVSSQWLDNGNNIYFDDKVGIGLNNPQETLDISGNFRQLSNMVNIIRTAYNAINLSSGIGRYIGFNIGWSNTITSDLPSFRISGRCHLIKSDTEYAYRRFDVLITPRDESGTQKPKLLFTTEASNYTSTGFSNLITTATRIDGTSIELKVQWDATVTSYYGTLQIEMCIMESLGVITYNGISG